MTHDELIAAVRGLDDEQLHHFLSYLTALADQPVTFLRAALSFATTPAPDPGETGTDVTREPGELALG